MKSRTIEIVTSKWNDRIEIVIYKAKWNYSVVRTEPGPF